MISSAQVSIYPLKQPKIGPIIEETRAIFKRHGLDIHPGSMSTVVSGEFDTLFAALQEAYRTATEGGQAVMVITLSNACPGPDPSNPI